MKRPFALGALVLASAVPVTSDACGRGLGCGRCRRPAPVFVQPMPVPCAAPIVTAPCPCTTPMTVPMTQVQIQRQAQVIDVPVTTQRQVVVDQGRFELVWKPNLTTQTVTETTIQRQVRFQDVPVTVMSTGIPAQAMISAPMMQSAMVPIADPISGMGTAGNAMVPPPYTNSPGTADASQGDSNWSKVPQRSASESGGVELQNFEVIEDVAVEAPVQRHVPSAVGAWRARAAF